MLSTNFPDVPRISNVYYLYVKQALRLVLFILYSAVWFDLLYNWPRNSELLLNSSLLEPIYT